MVNLKYHPDWDLFTLQKLPQGTGLKLGKAEDKKVRDYFWFLHEKIKTLIIQQQSYIVQGNLNASNT